LPAGERGASPLPGLRDGLLAGTAPPAGGGAGLAVVTWTALGVGSAATVAVVGGRAVASAVGGGRAPVVGTELDDGALAAAVGPAS
jgi:hypothetical protein